MVLALQFDDVYGESLFGVARKKALIDERLARVAITLVSP